jgi:hypothetical protein
LSLSDNEHENAALDQSRIASTMQPPSHISIHPITNHPLAPSTQPSGRALSATSSKEVSIRQLRACEKIDLAVQR